MPDEVVDCRGVKCPLPVLKTEKQLAQMGAGMRVVVLATDPIAKIDIPLFCTQNGHACEMSVEAEVMRFAITKGAA